MISELTDRKNKLLTEINENQKNPERIATTKGQNLQNLENTKKRNEEIIKITGFIYDKICFFTTIIC